MYLLLTQKRLDQNTQKKIILNKNLFFIVFPNPSEKGWTYFGIRKWQFRQNTRASDKTAQFLSASRIWRLICKGSDEILDLNRWLILSGVSITSFTFEVLYSVLHLTDPMTPWSTILW